MKALLISAGTVVLCFAALPRVAHPHAITPTAAVTTASGARIDVASAGIAPDVLRRVLRDALHDSRGVERTTADMLADYRPRRGRLQSR